MIRSLPMSMIAGSASAVEPRPADHGMVLEPLLKYIVEMMEIRQPHESMTIVVPQSMRPRWWSNLMRTQMASLLRLSLPLETGVVITDVPYQLDGDRD